MPKNPEKPKKKEEKTAPDPLFFYGGELSNFHISKFYDEKSGLTFFCNEQYMMYQKAVLFGDDEIAAKILAVESEPGQCKRFGRQVKNFDQETWNANAIQIVSEGAFMKFSQNKKLRNFLLSTGDRELVEASPTDRIWGIGFGCKDALNAPRDLWGENWLGLALMMARTRLKTELGTDSHG